MNNPLRYTPTDEPINEVLWTMPIPVEKGYVGGTEPVVFVGQKPMPIETRCVGCRWRIPQKLGGEGILCERRDGECPEWAVQWAVNYLGKSLTTDDDILEAMRL